MVIQQCYLTNNDCYKKGLNKEARITPKGIVVHSTGCNQKLLRRFVQPSKDDPNYDAIIADIGLNPNGNSWNRSGLDVCVHAFIGCNKAGKVEVYNTLPYNYPAWGVANGTKGSFNYNPTGHIQFEMMEDGLNDEKYFNEVMKAAIEYCAYLLAKFKLPVSSVVSHHEAYEMGYGSNHSDCDHWLKKFNKDMNWFREEIKNYMSNYYAIVGPFENETDCSNFCKYLQTAEVIKTKPADTPVQEETNPAENVINVSPIKVGDKVKLKSNAVVYTTGQKFSSWVYDTELFVRAIDGVKVTVSTLKEGAITGTVHLKFLTKVS